MGQWKKCGTWKYWDNNGTLMYEENYIADNLIGKSFLAQHLHKIKFYL